MAAILENDDVREDFGHLYRVEKTAASSILKIDDVTEDDNHLETVQTRAAARRFPRLSPKYEVSQLLGELASIESETLPGQPEQFQDDLRALSQMYLSEQKLEADRWSSSCQWRHGKLSRRGRRPSWKEMSRPSWRHGRRSRRRKGMMNFSNGNMRPQRPFPAKLARERKNCHF